jgi:hypothetical protein
VARLIERMARRTGKPERGVGSCSTSDRVDGLVIL